MPFHARARQATGPRELPPAVGGSIPFVIFCTTLFIVYQVNHHRQLEGMISATQALHEDEHFVTGGRVRQEKDLRWLGRAFGRGTAHTDIAGSPEAISSHAGSGQQAGSTTAGATASPVSTGSDTGSLAGVQQQQQQVAGGGEGTGASISPVCHAEAHAEYHGEVVQWGSTHIVGSAAECCAACQKRAADGCNIWVYCGEEECGQGGQHHPRGECWLKKAPLDEVTNNFVGKGHPGIKWTSGVVYTEPEWAAHLQRASAKDQSEATRLQALRDNTSLPLVWMDVSIKGKPAGRMEFVLFTHISPLAAENMRRMCTGEVSPKHTLKGINFYRIIDQFIDQTGVDVSPCALGGMFKDDPEGLKLKHDRKGLLSVANMGHNTNTGHFSILMGPAPHLNGGYVIFGELVSGWQVAEAINALSRGRTNNELLHSQDALIIDVGQLRQGVPVAEDVIKAGLVDHTS